MKSIHEELRSLLIEHGGDNPTTAQQLADELGISRSTLRQWLKGKNLPHPIIAEAATRFLHYKNIASTSLW